MTKSKHLIRPLVIGGVVLGALVSFQNCGGGFEALNSAVPTQLSSEGELVDDEDTPTAEVPPPSQTPRITPQVRPQSIPMNVTVRVALPVVDTDTTPAQINFVVVTPARSGQVAINAVGSTERSFSYVPNSGFIGEDTITLYPVDPEGNRGPNQTLRLSVEARGIGQMVGTFSHPTCVPNTSPVIASNVSTLTNFTFRETIFSADCATPILEHIITGNHSVGLENVATLSGLTGFEYNVTNHASTVRPLSALAAQTLNAQAYCGLTGWVANIARDITLTGCNGVWASRTIYMYRRVEFPPAGPARLYLSDLTTGVGTSPQTRTRGLGTLVLTKVP